MVQPLSPNRRRDSPPGARKRKRSSSRPNLFDVPEQREVEVAQNHGFASGSLPKRARRKLVHQGVLSSTRDHGTTEDSQQGSAAEQQSQLEGNAKDKPTAGVNSGQKWTASDDSSLQHALDKGMKPRDIAATIFPRRGYSAIRTRVVYLQTKALRDRSKGKLSPTVQVSPQIRATTTLPAAQTKASTTHPTLPSSTLRTTTKNTQPKKQQDRVATHKPPIDMSAPPSSQPRKARDEESDNDDIAEGLRHWTPKEDEHILHALAEGKEGTEIAETAATDFPSRTFSEVRARVRHVQRKTFKEMLAGRTLTFAKTPDRRTLISSSSAFLSSAVKPEEWTPEDNRILRDAVTEGKTPAEIAYTLFPGRGYESVRGRIRRLRAQSVAPAVTQTPLKWTPEEDRVLLQAHAERMSHVDIAKFHLPNRNAGGVRKRLQRLQGPSETTNPQLQTTTGHVTQAAKTRNGSKWKPEEDLILIEEKTKNTPFAEIARAHFPTRSLNGVQKRWKVLENTGKASLNTLIPSSTPAQLDVSSAHARRKSFQPPGRELKNSEPSASSALAKIRDMKKSKRSSISRSVSTDNAPLSSSQLDDPSQTQLTILPGGKIRFQPNSRSQSRGSSQIEGEGGGENDEAYHSQSSPTKQNHVEPDSRAVQLPNERSNSTHSTNTAEKIDDIVDQRLDLAHDPISDESDYDGIDDDELLLAAQAMPSSPPTVILKFPNRHSSSPIQEGQSVQIRSVSPPVSENGICATSNVSVAHHKEDVNPVALSSSRNAPLKFAKSVNLLESEKDPISRVASPSQQLLESESRSVSALKSASVLKTVPPSKIVSKPKAATKLKATSPLKNTSLPVALKSRYVPLFSAARLARMREDDDENDDESSDSSTSSSSDESDRQPLARTPVQITSIRRNHSPHATSKAIPAKATTTKTSATDESEAEEVSSGGSTPIANERYLPKQGTLVEEVDGLIDEALEVLTSVPGTPLRGVKAVNSGTAAEEGSSSSEEDSSSSEEDDNLEEENSDGSGSGSESEEESDDDEQSENEIADDTSGLKVCYPAIRDDAAESEWGGVSDMGGNATPQSAIGAKTIVDDANDSSVEEGKSSAEEDDSSSTSSEDESSSAEENSSSDEDSSSDDDSADEEDKDTKEEDAMVKSRPAFTKNKLSAAPKGKPIRVQKNQAAGPQKLEPARLKPQNTSNLDAKKRGVKLTIQQDEIARLLEETAGLKSSQPAAITRQSAINRVPNVTQAQRIASDDGDEEMGEAYDESKIDADSEVNWLMDRVKRKMRDVFPVWG
jgi:hypothetical protein